MTVGLLNVVLGTIYTSYGLMTLVDLKRGWRTHGFSHFGMAWLAMAFTCGPHHLDHGIHLLATDRSGGPLDLVAILVGVPAGVTWFLLRVEAMLGGRGDRFVPATPLWLDALPMLGVAYLGLLGVAVADLVAGGRFEPLVTPNLALVGLYAAIGVLLTRTQLSNHPVTGGWSLSGVSLATVMFSCALMHGIYAAYGTTGRYDLDVHGLIIAWASVPAAAYFLWVVWALHRGVLRDWNEGADVDGPGLLGEGRAATVGVGP